MKPNTFFIITGLIALIEVGIFWAAIEMNAPLLIQVAVVAGIILIYLAKRTVETVIDDERTKLIAEKAASRTLEVFWIVFFIMSLGSIVFAFNRPLGIHPPPPVPIVESRTFGIFGFAQLSLLCLMIFLYVAFRLYYGRKYGASESDEE